VLEPFAGKAFRYSAEIQHHQAFYEIKELSKRMRKQLQFARMLAQ